jgi:hypothetical protein
MHNNKKQSTIKQTIFLFFLILPFLTFLTWDQAEAAGFRLIYANDNLGELNGCG